MTVTLDKDEKVSLTKDNPNLSKIAVTLRWDVSPNPGEKFDLDATALLTGPGNKVLSDKHFVFWKNKTSPDTAVQHSGDNLVGGGDGEIINVDLDSIDPKVDALYFPVSIFEADKRGQTFQRVDNATIEVDDLTTGDTLVFYNLTKDAADKTALVVARVGRDGHGGWDFTAVGQPYESGLWGICSEYGVEV